MKPQSVGTQRRTSTPKLCGTEAVISFQEELVAVIHGAFEVAVEIAVREVKTFVSQATGDIYQELQKENESLKQKLQRAEALLDSVSPHDQPRGPKQREATHSACRRNPSPNADGEGVKGDSSGLTEPNYDLQDEFEELRRCESGSVSEQDSDLNCGSEDVRSHGSSVKVETTIPGNQDSQAPDSDPPPCTDSRSTSEGVTVKREEPEEDLDDAACCLDLIKEESLSLENMRWPPEVSHVQSQNPNIQLFNNLDQAHPPNLTTSLSQPTDLQSISSEFPNIFHQAEPGVISQAPSPGYGVHVRTGRHVAAIHGCKFCGQSFHLPSLLRRHYGQCRHRLQQRCQQPIAGNTRTKLQLYPPGCSPFRCTVCNREFNRLENLKTHLRIHTGERPYTCSVCSKCFRHSGALTRHFRIHTGEKPYICGQCGKSFRNCGGLRFHQRSHNKHLQ